MHNLVCSDPAAANILDYNHCSSDALPAAARLSAQTSTTVPNVFAPVLYITGGMKGLAQALARNEFVAGIPLFAVHCEPDQTEGLKTKLVVYVANGCGAPAEFVMIICTVSDTYADSRSGPG